MSWPRSNRPCFTLSRSSSRGSATPFTPRYGHHQRHQLRLRSFRSLHVFDGFRFQLFVSFDVCCVYFDQCFFRNFRFFVSIFFFFSVRITHLLYGCIRFRRLRSLRMRFLWISISITFFIFFFISAPCKNAVCIKPGTNFDHDCHR